MVRDRDGPGPGVRDRGGPIAPRLRADPAGPRGRAPPPPPLSKEALTGSVPLRTFGQLKQLWEARVEEPGEEGASPAPRKATSRIRACAGDPARRSGSSQANQPPDAGRRKELHRSDPHPGEAGTP